MRRYARESRTAAPLRRKKSVGFIYTDEFRGVTIGAATLRERISRPFMLLLVVAMTSAWLAAVTILRSTLIDTLDRRLEYSVSVLASGTLPLTPELLNRAGLVTGLDFALIDKEGHTIASTIALDAADALTRSPEVLELIRSQPTLPHTAKTTGGRRVAAKQVAGRAMPEGVSLVAIASLDDIRQSVGKAAAWFALTLLGAGLMLYLLGRRVSLAISRPISELGTYAERISSGERNIDNRLEGPKELQKLGEIMASMAQRIDDTEAEMMRQNRYKALGEMAARIAHEIRNPLTAIKMQLQLMQESADVSGREKLQRVLNETARLEMIAANTLSLGGDLAIRTQPVELDSIAAEVIELLRPQFQHQHITLRFEPGCETPLPLDADRVKQALLNLLVNAADALVKGGEVRVATLEGHHSAVLVVEDDGPGIAADRRDVLFDNPTSDKKFGLGLGLVVARQVAEAHGGQLTVMDSERLGGAEFRMEFPRSATVETE